jgi:hypothetical protein
MPRVIKLSFIMLSVIMVFVIMLSVIMLSVIMLNVDMLKSVSPVYRDNYFFYYSKFDTRGQR